MIVFLTSPGRTLRLLLSFLFAALTISAKASPATKTAYDFSTYHTPKQVLRTMRKLAKRHQNLTRLHTIGRSLRGHELLLMELSNPEAGARGKPALMLVGGLRGDENVGTEMALYSIHRLLNSYRSDPEITALLDSVVFYILPMPNPDAMQLRFEKLPTTVLTNMRPKDEDRDGSFDEDPPEDLDGDGYVLQMRVRDSAGKWRAVTDSAGVANPRSMRKAETARGETGQYKLYPTEGFDNDGDEEFNEDGPGGVRLDHNFPIHWALEHEQADAGPFPLSEPESKAIVDFMLAHRHIAGLQVWGGAGGRLDYPPAGTGAKSVAEEDMKIFKSMAEEFKKMVKGGEAGAASEAGKKDQKSHGALLDWGYFGYGVTSFGIRPWTVPEAARGDTTKQKEAKRGKKDDGKAGDEEGKWLDWNDAALKGSGFVPWRPFKHPQLGDVEIGGWKPFVRETPPPGEHLRQVCETHFPFVLYHARSLPSLAIHKLAAKRISPGVFEVVMEVENRGYLPTVTKAGEKARVAGPVIASIALAGKAELLQGTGRQKLEHLDGSHARREVRWIVRTPRASAKALVTIRSDKAGVVSREVMLK